MRLLLGHPPTSAPPFERSAPSRVIASDSLVLYSSRKWNTEYFVVKVFGKGQGRFSTLGLT